MIDLPDLYQELGREAILSLTLIAAQWEVAWN